MGNNNSWLGMLLFGVFLSAGIIAGTLIIAKTVQQVKFQNQRIQVKGFAERTITSDVAVWRGQVTTRAPDLVTAYSNLQLDLEKVLTYLAQKGISRDDMDIPSVITTIQYQITDQGMTTNVVDGYILFQPVSITSSNIEQIADIANEITVLIKEGVEFDSFPPQYFFSKLDDIKIELLGEATKNAYMRAEQLAQNSGSEVGSLKYASQGVFQITPVYSTDVSDYGTYDTSTIEKSAKAVVTIEYSIR